MSKTRRCPYCQCSFLPCQNPCTRKFGTVVRELQQRRYFGNSSWTSALTSVADKVLLLELGADDYVSKPFSPRELLARVQAAIRHANKAPIRDVAEFDRISVDFPRMEVMRDGHPGELAPQEFKLLKFFLQHPDNLGARQN